MDEKYKLAKWLDGELTDAELKEFQADPDFSLYEKIKLYSSQIETPTFDEDKILTSVLEIKKQNSKVIPLRSDWFKKIAAILVIGFGFFLAYNTFTSTSQLAENGKQTSFLLPDSSEVVLNAGSQIDFKKWNWNNNRNLNLQGEAYFKVAKGKKFEVITTLGKVSVIGTQFNVKARENRFIVTCFEGKVKVLQNNNEVILSKGQVVTFNGVDKLINQTSNSKPLWTENELQFDKETLRAVIDEIQRQYDIKIDATKINSNQLFTGKIPKDNIDVSLKIITSIYHLNYLKISNSSYIIEDKK